jgi:hypothetical protein
MSERMGNHPEIPDKSPHDAISSFLYTLEFQSLLLPSEQKVLYEPLLHTLRIALQHDRLLEDQLAYQKTHQTAYPMDASQFLLHNEQLRQQYPTDMLIIGTDIQHLFIASQTGWSEKIGGPKLIGIDTADEKQLLIRADYIGDPLFSQHAIPGTKIGAIRFAPDRGEITCITQRRENEIYDIYPKNETTDFPMQHADPLLRIIERSQARVLHRYRSMLEKTKAVTHRPAA